MGDFWQFVPVSFLSKPALYQGLVQQARCRRLENNDAYVVGVNLFSKFKVFWLKGQHRYKEDPEFQKYLRVLRDVEKKHPINSGWIKKLQKLSKEDVDLDKGWEFATIATTGNVERMNIIKYQAKRYGNKINEPILTWRCPVRKGKDSKGKNIYGDIDLSSFRRKNQFVILDKYFIRGAECVLAENTCTALGIAKGTTGKMIGLV